MVGHWKLEESKLFRKSKPDEGCVIRSFKFFLVFVFVFNFSLLFQFLVDLGAQSWILKYFAVLRQYHLVR